jgi:hypothetical protein
MYACPHCGEETLGAFQVRWSYRESPAECPKCGKLWHVLASSSSGVVGVEIVLFAMTLVVSISLVSYLVFFLGIALVVSKNWWSW